MFQIETPSWAKFVLFMFASQVIAITARAQIHSIQAVTEAIDPTTYADHYTLDETSQVSTETNLLFEAVDTLEPLYQPAKKVLLSLTAFIRHKKPAPAAPEKYNRKNHFGSWKMDLSNCLDVRGRVLTRDSLDPVTTHQSGERCVVNSGRWNDPYTGTVQTDPRELQIDHMVPLKNAYIMGGFAWSQEKKCWYANFLPTKYHLIAVSSHENTSKSDKTPAEYIPPTRRYQCEYVRNWLKIKMAWQLRLIEPEVQAIQDVVKQNSCKDSELAISTDELKQVRLDIAGNSSLCK